MELTRANGITWDMTKNDRIIDIIATTPNGKKGAIKAHIKGLKKGMLTAEVNGQAVKIPMNQNEVAKFELLANSRVKMKFSSIDSFREFEKINNCGQMWFEGESVAVWAYV